MRRVPLRDRYTQKILYIIKVTQKTSLSIRSTAFATVADSLRFHVRGVREQLEPAIVVATRRMPDATD